MADRLGGRDYLIYANYKPERMGHRRCLVPHLRGAMLEELQRRNYAKNTIDCYPQGRRAIRQGFPSTARPAQSPPLREYQAYLLRERQLELDVSARAPGHSR